LGASGSAGSPDAREFAAAGETDETANGSRVSERASNVVAGVCGIGFVVFVVVGFGALIRYMGDLNDPNVDGMLRRSPSEVWAGGYIELLAFVLFLVFAGRLWSLLRAAEGGSGWVSTTGFAALLVSVAFGLAALSSGATAFFLGRRGADEDVLVALLDLRSFTFVLTGPMFALFLGAVALVVLRTRVLAHWVGWTALLLAAVYLVTTPLATSDVAQTPQFLQSLWIVAVAILLIVRRDELHAGVREQPAGAARAG
jgi:hypothetical protein